MWPCLEAVFKELDRVKWGHKGGVLIQYDQCTYKRRNWYQECARTEERTQSEGCHMNAKKKDLQGKPALTASWSWTSGLQNCEKMNYRHLSNLAWDILLCQLFTFLLPPSKLLYMVKEALPCRTLIYISCITLCHNPLPLYPPEISVLSVPLCVSDWPKSSNSHLLFLTHPQGPREGCLYSLSTLSPCFSHLLPQPWRLSTHGWIYDPSIPRFYHLSLISQIKTHAFLSWALLVFTLVGWTLLRWTISTYIHAKLLRLCLTLCDPMDCSPSGPSVHGILQARILGWVAMSFSRGSSWPTSLTSHALAGGFFTTSATWEVNPLSMRFLFSPAEFFSPF